MGGVLSDVCCLCVHALMMCLGVAWRAWRGVAQGGALQRIANFKATLTGRKRPPWPNGASHKLVSPTQPIGFAAPSEAMLHEADLRWIQTHGAEPRRLLSHVRAAIPTPEKFICPITHEVMRDPV